MKFLLSLIKKRTKNEPFNFLINLINNLHFLISYHESIQQIVLRRAEFSAFIRGTCIYISFFIALAIILLILYELSWIYSACSIGLFASLLDKISKAITKRLIDLINWIPKTNPIWGEKKNYKIKWHEISVRH